METKVEQMYATMKPWRLFFIIAVPGMISMFAMSIYSVIEGAFIGRALGEHALAAVNIGLPLALMIFSISDLVAVGASAPISIALGKGDKQRANNIFTCSVLLILLVSSLMGVAMFFVAEPLARMMGAEGELLRDSVKYLRTWALCSPLAALFFGTDNYLRISGYVKTSMVINVLSNLLTVILLAFFLLVCDMDVVGAALATNISLTLSAFVSMSPFLAKKTLLRFIRPRFSGAMLREIFFCGSPVFLNNISSRLAAIMINASLITLGAKELGEGGGTTAVAIYAVLMYASDFCWPLLYGVSDSLSPVLGYNWGAKRYDRVRAIVRCAYIGAALIGLVSTAVLFFFPQAVASLFVEKADTRLLSLSVPALRIFCLAYLFRWFGVVTQSFLSAIKKPFLAMIMGLAVSFVLPVGLLGALWSFGLDGIWFNFVGVNALLALLGVALLIVVLRDIKRREQKL